MIIDDRFRDLIKAESENLILRQGGQICLWLNPIGEPNIRDLDEIKNRLIVMNALVHLKSGMPFKDFVLWVKKHKKTACFSDKEKLLLTRIQKNGLTPIELSYLNNYSDGIYALMWALCLVTEMPIHIPSEKIDEALLDISINDPDNINELEQISGMRPIGDIYEMLDYYYRFHWFYVEEAKQGKNSDIEMHVYQKRKVLEWIYDGKRKWDDELPNF